ncbi:MAG: outer membrane protein assembly factor BamE [Gammaproteobacteria bacterium]|nr:outer membrane protein assembly factor BamE [Gammaproteobacteria bacterium]MBI5783770.1 outer membrane protein assembly factor BamE [Gammaproteobacteria bacterium]
MHPPLRDRHLPVPLLRFRLAVITLCATLPLGACFSFTIPVHKLDIQQGNVVTQEMVDRLKPGMTRAQVRFVLGTPPVTDAFHRDRWDYFYSFKVGAEGVAETRRLTLTFQDDVLRSVQGDIAVKNPSGTDFRDSPEGASLKDETSKNPAETAPTATPDKPAS